MKEIILTQGKLTIVDDDDFEILSAYKWRLVRRATSNYAGRTLDNSSRSTILMHQQIFGTYAAGTDIDHKDGDGLNNQRSNLRMCTTTQNSQNKRKRKPLTSIYKGVYFDKDKNKFRSQIVVDGKRKHLGLFVDEKEAAKVYNDAAMLYFKEFACLNEL